MLWSGKMSTIVRIAPSDAFDKMETSGFVYVDVRTEAEFADGHPEGALNLPLMRIGEGGMMPNNDFLTILSALFPRDAKLILGCKSGARSMRAAQMLMDAGYTAFVEQRAGWDGARDAFGQLDEPGWSRAGLPTSTGEPLGASYAELRAKAGLF